MDHYIGRRLSLKSQLCTVRYIGPVADKSGDWLGVEWDDTGRGKHDGTHDGKQYFQCRSKSATAASFLRPNQPWDKPRTFYQALREKYMPEDAGTGAEIVYFSTKQAEEVGFEKFAKRQAALQGIHTLVLDHMCIGGTLPEDEKRLVSDMCKEIIQLDVGSNLFECVEDVLDLIELFPKLRHLVLNGNRLSHLTDARDRTFPRINDLYLSETLLSSTELSVAMRHFPRVARWTAGNNELGCFGIDSQHEALLQLDLSGNSFQALDELKQLASCPGLRTLILKHDQIARPARTSPSGTSPVSETIDDLDLAYNAISSWSFFDSLPVSFPGLKHLRVSGNPLYANLKSADGKPLTAEDGYMLTIARLPQLKTLNYSKITEKERLNAETYYMDEIAAEIRQSTAEKYSEVIGRHTRWQALCQEYGEPVIDKKPRVEDVDPNSLAARLVKFTFALPSSIHRTPPEGREKDLRTTWTAEVPKSFNIYALLGMIGKRLGVLPLSLRLIWETGEQDPIAQNDSYDGPEWWDSSDDEDDKQALTQSTLVTREVELAAGTRAIGTYIEGNKARVRVEVIRKP